MHGDIISVPWYSQRIFAHLLFPIIHTIDIDLNNNTVELLYSIL